MSVRVRERERERNGRTVASCSPTVRLNRPDASEEVEPPTGEATNIWLEAKDASAHDRRIPGPD